jgi:cyclopropane-fatty-acyl-phospholipid synthase
MGTMGDRGSTALAVASKSLKPWSGTLAERLFARLLRGLQIGSLTVICPTGRRLQFHGARPGPRAQIEVRRWRLLRRVLFGGYLGFAEGFLEDDWRTPDLTAVLTLGMLNAGPLAASFQPSSILTLLNRLRHARRANTKRGARRNIAAHYDLGNEFFGAWLDPTMSYSSALFATMAEPHANAQRRKYIRLARILDLRPGDRVLEIGCGWGAFAEIAAAEFGCEVVCITLSEQQAGYARARMAELGLGDRVDIRLQDYRDVTGAFDKIVSIEMFEAVGEQHWRGYFDILQRLLVPGGRAGLQVITIADDAFESYRRNPDFVQRFIFPGGMLPSRAAFARAAEAAGLGIADVFTFGKSYAESLRRWDAAFTASWPRIAPLGFDERFFRMWRFYLAYCETGFELGCVDVGQFVIERA